MVKITELAAQKVKEVLKAQNKENALLRLYLVGMGCGGPNFGMTLDESKTEDDVLDQEHGVSIVVETKLSMYLEGAVIDYIESDNGGGFEIRMAKMPSSGGCDSGCCGGCGGSC
ncbi:HesB/IscA family protein [Desulfosporosinus youngiae]|uniref:Iron-sulfur cluster assembly accessory protein n=1 Tax=Desulfosporosinus youngiae DSM 17734 TaxID=768710 RepID=H5Y194_9FIRM|nr:iron-sulfur cluster assembly accessory protein [Desulfosporosinus youngiae]EHQ87432.1 Iron-sulfur cluster assembly accessory protein [Desulfosporosinus youngiae DSM 17734]